MTFCSKIPIFGVVPKDRHGKANRRIQSFLYEDDKGRKNQGNKESQFSFRNYSDSLSVVTPRPGNRSSSFSSSSQSDGNIGPPRTSPADTIPCHLLESLGFFAYVMVCIVKSSYWFEPLRPWNGSIVDFL
jgi:hypothetical protein